MKWVKKEDIFQRRHPERWFLVNTSKAKCELRTTARGLSESGLRRNMSLFLYIRNWGIYVSEVKRKS